MLAEKQRKGVEFVSKLLDLFSQSVKGNIKTLIRMLLKDYLFF